jgi:glycosyltransferase involved in cell wall biosynthesis
MKIAVDARPLSHPLAGIGRYTDSLLRELIPRGNDWYLYSDRPLLEDYSTLGSVIVRTPEKVVKPGAIWSQFGFVRWARDDDVDLFWSPRHHLPLFLPRKMKKLLTVHDLVWLRYPRTMKPRGWLLELMFMPLSLLLSDRIIAVSRFSADEVSNTFHISMDKIETIPEAVFSTSSDMEADVSPELLDDRFFLFVGTPEPRKNLQRLLEAYKIFLAQGMECSPKLYIVGGSGWGQQISETIQTLDLEGHVYVLNRINDAALEEVYKHAVALLMPALYEGFGLPILEAMSHGTPVVTSDRSSLPEVAGDAALLVNPYDVKSISDAMEAIFSDKKLRSELSSKALLQAKKFSWKESADQTMAVIEGLLSR